MECELNPRIPYTELSHIIKKQKEVAPACSGPCLLPPEGRGEAWGCVGPWELSLESPLRAGSGGGDGALQWHLWWLGLVPALGSGCS